jgi:hypothetical protein
VSSQKADPNTGSTTDIVDNGRDLPTDDDVRSSSQAEQQKQPHVIFDDEYADIEFNQHRVFKPRK